MNTDRWYYRVFQSAPDLIRALLPGAAAASAGLALDPCEPGDRLYRFEALEQKEVSHRHDGVLWPRDGTGVAETGSAVFPVVLLEVQMQSDPGFQARLAAQSLRFVQRHPQVEHLELVVITPHRRLSLGSERPPPVVAGGAAGGVVDQPGGPEPAARPRSAAQPAHVADPA